MEFSLKSTYGADEISWSVEGTACTRSVYSNYQTSQETCCMEEGEYNVLCKDAGGDGWHGGVLQAWPSSADEPDPVDVTS